MSTLRRLASLIRDLKTLNLIEDNDQVVCDVINDKEEINLIISRFCYNQDEFKKRVEVIEKALRDEFENDSTNPIIELNSSSTEIKLRLKFR